jgi:hypothetical protein
MNSNLRVAFCSIVQLEREENSVVFLSFRAMPRPYLKDRENSKSFAVHTPEHSKQV